MPKWSVEVYFSACETVEVEADSYQEACDKGFEMAEDPHNFFVEEIECYRIWEDEGEDEEDA